MARKLNIPSVVGLNIEGMPYGMIVFLQSIQDGMITLDNNVVYKDTIKVQPPAQSIKAKAAQGQAFSISGLNLASGDDYAVLVQDFQKLLTDHLALRDAHLALVEQLKGN